MVLSGREIFVLESALKRVLKLSFQERVHGSYLT